MEIAQVRGLLAKVDPTPLFFILVFRMLDIFTTRVAFLLVPGTYEGMTLGNNLLLSLGFVVFPLLIQLFGIWYQEASRTAKAGNWLLVIISVMPILNNLEVLRIG